VVTIFQHPTEMDIDKRIADLEDKLRRMESRYSQSNPVDVLLIRAMKREIARLLRLSATEKMAEAVEK